jgi:hypothetical protein
LYERDQYPRLCVATDPPDPLAGAATALMEAAMNNTKINIDIAGTLTNAALIGWHLNVAHERLRDIACEVEVRTVILNCSIDRLRRAQPDGFGNISLPRTGQ